MPKPLGNGLHRNGGVQVSVYFDKDTFADVREYATKQGISLNAAVLELTTWGILDAKEKTS